MCGRYVIEWLPDEITERFQLKRLPLPSFDSFNAAPTQELPVVLEAEDGERELRTMRWGLVPRWAKPGETKAPAPFNARAETLLEKPMFRNLIARKRCLVPATGYYEWRPGGGRGKQPYLFRTTDQEIFAFAGLYDAFDDGGAELSSYTVVTTEPNALTAQFHHRMPVILPQGDEEEWLSRDITDGHQVERLLRPYPAEQMAYHAVSPAVNNVRNNDRSLIEAVDDGSTVDGRRSTEDDDEGQQARLL